MPAIFHDQVQKELECPITDFVLPPELFGGNTNIWRFCLCRFFIKFSLFLHYFHRYSTAFFHIFSLFVSFVKCLWLSFILCFSFANVFRIVVVTCYFSFYFSSRLKYSSRSNCYLYFNTSWSVYFACWRIVKSVYWTSTSPNTFFWTKFNFSGKYLEFTMIASSIVDN